MDILEYKEEEQSSFLDKLKLTVFGLSCW